LRADRHRQRASHGSHVPCEAELAGEFETVEVLGRQLPGRNEDAERDRQIETARVFRKIGGRQVDGDVARREFEARVL
jgi:hypothetical protein